VTAQALEQLARALADDPERWAHLVRHDPEQRVYELLRHDPDVMAWLICWSDDHDTGFHDHDVSSGAVAVVQGSVCEERLRLGAAPSRRVVRAGETFAFAADDIHRVRHVGDQPAVTVHVYSPPLWRMGAYVVEDGGTLRRQSLSYAEELRPLAA
jgi:quercetin dioxygenase-like cupin family protein